MEMVVAKRARLITVEQKGAGPARNGGVDVSSGEILAFLDADCRPASDWIAEGVAGLAGYDIIGGKVDVLVQDVARMTPVEAFECVFAFDIERYFTQKGFVGSGNLFCRRSVFDSVGGFGYGVSEDVDWCHRATAKHFTIRFAPRARVGHPARRTWEELRTKWSRINAETYALKTRRRNGRMSWMLACLMLPASVLGHIPRILASEHLNSKQKAAALWILFRIRFWRMWDYLRLFLHGSKA